MEREVIDKLTHWLHVHGIIRISSMTSHSLDPTLTVRIQSGRHIPKRAVVWRGRRYLLYMRPSAGGTHRLARIDRGGVTLAGKRQWELTYLPAPRVSTFPRDMRPLSRERVDAS
jgi:hypothetical protein